MPATLYPDSFVYNDLEKIHNFFESLKADKDIIKSYSDKWKILVPLFDQISAYNSVLIALYNVADGCFIYAVDKRNVVGYDMSLYLAEDGMRFSHDNAHPDYIDAGLQMQQEGMEYVLQHTAETEQNKIIVSFDYMYKKSDGSYMHVLQQSMIIASDDNGHPLLFLNYIRDITYLKKDKTANLVITTPNDIKIWNYNFYDRSLDPVHPFSKQEKKVLSYLAKGKHSKEIAAEFFNSTSTIDTHRRNLLKKTNCLDTSGLITYARLVGLLCLIEVFGKIFLIPSLYFHVAHAISSIFLFIHFKLIPGLHLYSNVLLILIPKIIKG